MPIGRRRKILPVPANFDNREPASTLAPTGEVELYFASNRTDGWNTWTRLVTPSTQGPEANVTNGQATRRAPALLRIPPTRVRRLHQFRVSGRANFRCPLLRF